MPAARCIQAVFGRERIRSLACSVGMVFQSAAARLGRPGGAVKSLRAVEKLDFERIIPGHGPATAPAQAVRETREYFEDLIAAVKEAMQKTRDVDKIKEMVRLPKYEKWGMYDRWLPLNVERIAGWLNVGQ